MILESEGLGWQVKKFMIVGKSLGLQVTMPESDISEICFRKISLEGGASGGERR